MPIVFDLDRSVDRKELIYGRTGQEHRRHAGEPLLVSVRNVANGVQRSSVRRAEGNECPSVAPSLKNLEPVARDKSAHAVRHQDELGFGLTRELAPGPQLVPDPRVEGM